MTENYKIRLFLFLTFSITGCINAHKYGFVNEVDGAYTIIKDVTMPDKPKTGCDSLSNKKKQECLKSSKNLLIAINTHSEK